MSVSFVYSVQNCSKSNLNWELGLDFIVILKVGLNIFYAAYSSPENVKANNWIYLDKYIEWRLSFLRGKFGGLTDSFTFNKGIVPQKLNRIQNLR